jgi:ribosomal protein S18 acetylase RimI-like enzyme
VTVEDWRNVSAADVAGLYDRERERWRSRLGWDVGPSLDVIESGRLQGRVPGYLARAADGTLAGWTYYILERRTLQIGALWAHTTDTLRTLLDRVLRSPEAEAALELMCFVFVEQPALESALLRRRFSVTPFFYLGAAADACRTATGIPDDVGALRRLDAEVGPPLVRLLARAYAGQGSARCFAPHGRMEEWAQYVGGLLHGQACGRLLPEASFVAGGSDRGEADGAVITTALGPSTAHIAQIAVGPDHRGRGLARRLMHAAAGAAAGLGYAELTLLVAGDNERALRFYAGLGFGERARFLYGRRPALRRTIAAPLLTRSRSGQPR